LLNVNQCRLPIAIHPVFSPELLSELSPNINVGKEGFSVILLITGMPATCRSVPEETHPTASHSLICASKMQLNALTVTALKSHLKHFGSLTTGNKAALLTTSMLNYNHPKMLTTHDRTMVVICQSLLIRQPSAQVINYPLARGTHQLQAWVIRQQILTEARN